MVSKSIIITLILLCLSTYADAYEKNWKAIARFYSSNYPGLTSNQKAKMLAEDMKDAGETFEIVKTCYRIELLYIYQQGVRIWPPYDFMLEKYKELDYLGKKMIEYKGGKDEPVSKEGR